jgi:RHS repeat-associated protein
MGIYTATWYSRDASGNTMATYSSTEIDKTTESRTLTELNIFGSDRLGIFKLNKKLLSLPELDNPLKTHERGLKLYELKNLPITIGIGNVISVVSDRLLSTGPNSNNKVNKFEAETCAELSRSILKYSDYYPFGFEIRSKAEYSRTPLKINYYREQMPDRANQSVNYRYGFNGIACPVHEVSGEKDKEFTNSTSHYDFGARIYDSRLGRWLAVDKFASVMPFYTPYRGFLNNPIVYVDPSGNIEYITIIVVDERSGKSIKMRKKTDNLLMTDGVIVLEKSMGHDYTNYNYYYDYEIITTVVIDKDGNETTSTETRIMKENGVKNKDGVWIGGDKDGDTMWDLEGIFQDLINEVDDGIQRRKDGRIVKGGIHIWGSNSSDDGSPAVKSSDPWGFFNFEEFSELMSLALESVKNMKERDISNPDILDITSSFVETIETIKEEKMNGRDGKKMSTYDDNYKCNTCDSVFSSRDTLEAKKRLHGSMGYEKVKEENTPTQ